MPLSGWRTVLGGPVLSDDVRAAEVQSVHLVPLLRRRHTHVATQRDAPYNRRGQIGKALYDPSFG